MESCIFNVVAKMKTWIPFSEVEIGEEFETFWVITLKKFTKYSKNQASYRQSNTTPLKTFAPGKMCKVKRY